MNGDGYAYTGQEMLGTNMFAYCGSNPVNRIDLNGQFWAELWEFTKTAASEIGNAIQSAAPIYAGCGGIALADGFLPFGDVIGAIGATAVTVGAVGYGVYQASQILSLAIPKSEDKDIAIPAPPPNVGVTYYHVTTPENALAIMASQIMTGSTWEGGYVFAWRNRPNKHAIKNSGAKLGTIISFKTNVPFYKDNGIDDPLIQMFGPVKSSRPGPIVVWDVQIVG